MIRSMLSLAILVTMLIPASLLGTTTTSAQCSYAPGTPVSLAGTPHLFIVDDQGVLHWGGDTRALAGHVINWSNECAVSLGELLATPRGDPWLTAGLPKIGEPIYLAKWEDTEAAPRLLHIQSIADVELFGINTANYGNFILDRATWEQRFGFAVGSLEVGPLASAASFAWSDADRAAYGQLLLNMQGAETAAFFQATSAGTDAAAVLPSIADCERLGLDTFEQGRNASTALQRTTDCLFAGPAPTSLPTAGPSGQAPPPPLNVRVFPVSPTDLEIDWDPVSTATSYRVYGGDQNTPAGTLVELVQPGLSSTTIGGLVTGRSYCYSVSSVGPGGESTASGPVCAVPTFVGSIPPSASVNLLVVQVSASSVQLSWTPTSNNQDGFYIYDGDNLIATAPSNSVQWTISGWDPTVQHCYQVVAYNEFGQSAGSNVACAGAVPSTAQPTPTAIPASLTPTIPVATPSPAAAATNTPAPTLVPSTLTPGPTPRS